MMRRSVKNRRLRSKTMTRSGAEMTWEVRLDNKQDLVALMLGIEGVHDATLVACQTEAGTYPSEGGESYGPQYPSSA